jgi:hypothetical protein
MKGSIVNKERSKDQSRDSSTQNEPQKIVRKHLSAKSGLEEMETRPAVRMSSQAQYIVGLDKYITPSSNRDSAFEQECSLLQEEYFSAKPQNSKLGNKGKVLKPKMFIQSSVLLI